MRRIELDVLVVGAGPTGLTAAALLARMGSGVMAITRYPGLANSPRAHVINQRAMEIFRDLGIEDRVSAAAMPESLMGQVVWVESMSGREIGRRRAWGAGPDTRTAYLTASPCAVTNIPQHVLEPILSDAARENGAQIAFELELISMRQNADRVISICRDRRTGAETEIVSQYAIGADGDNSTVCREIGFDVEGVTGLGHVVNYWVEVDLTKYTAHRPGAMFQILRPGGRAAVDIAVCLCIEAWDQWVFSIPYDPADGEPDRSEAAAIRVARTYVGDETLEVRLLGASTWTVNQVHAELMHKGRVLIAGNAAHRHPPAGGLGANTCVQDAFNLAWKVRAVLDGVADPSLLVSYSQERAPVARQIVERANVLMKSLQALPAALGLRPGQSVEEGKAALDERFADTDAGRARRTGLTEALRLQDYMHNAIGFELGQRYISDAITADGVAPEPSDPILEYLPSTTPGSPLPHARLVIGDATVSSLDLVGHDRFTLLTRTAGSLWTEAAHDAASRWGITLEIVAIGAGQAVEDPYAEWARLSEIAEDGCLLVRPDRYVAFRSRHAPADPRGALTSALGKALGRA